ncbi:MAG: laminin G domain-containing protein, partial [Clostridia bacterium]|nr:laminin G domain-containing protein [Clostridia bacterium]
MKKLAVVFALAMALLLTVTAFADDPVISIDFENGAGDVELVNAEIVDDVTRGKVLKINGQGNGTARTSYGLFTTDIFENTNWENGLTVSMWIQTDVGSQTLSGTAPIYSIDIARIGYIATVCSLETTMNTDGNEPDTGISPRCWNDPVNVAGGVNKTDEGIWQLLTVVYSPDGIKIYVDGEFYADSPLGGGSMDMFLFEVEFATGLRLGAWNCDWWNYGDYQGLIDDVNVWNTALSEDDVFDIYADTKKAQTVVVKAPTVEELYTAEEHTPVYTLDFEDASALELVNAELVPGHAGNALKVSGTGVGTQGASYGLVKTDLFKDTDWTKGMTITMWVNAAQSDTLTGMAPIYSLDIGNQGYIGLVNSLQSGINTDGNEDIGIVPRFWNDPGNQGGSVNETRIGEWDQVTVVYNNDGANNMQIYRNGELVVRPGMNLGTQFGEGTNEQFFTEQLKMVYSLRLGSWLCVWWNNGDYEGLIDDLAIYNVALNPLEAKYLFTGMPEAADEPAAEAPAEEPAAPTYPSSGAEGDIINGTVIGNAEGWGGNADAGAAAAFDGNPATFFDPLGVGDGFCGIDAGESYILDKVV